MTQSTQMMEELDDCCMRTAGNIIKYYDNEEERQKMLKDLRECLKANCAISARTKAANTIRQQMECLFEPEGDITNITKEYKKAIDEIQVDPLQDPRLLEYDRQIESLLRANKSVSSQGVDDTDADLRLTDSQVNVIDPITKTRMTNPVRNAVCGHTYDKESLVAMLRKNKNTRCPVVGCTSLDYINLSQCRPDIAMKMYLEQNPA
ncbi:E3 SUMO-protein ligase NSE2 [Solenopsis invicta]|uniref:E3 SUMO-protein ligase NSE2 n=1 Tax=Solenopsis invicta TaxID=13686 RepID=UPI000595EF61|nr:E3 SUMO-protein ligase NSE2 [Solenopsis invicta]